MPPSNSVSVAPHERIELLVEQSIKLARTARKNRSSLSGMNFYADKLARIRTDATVAFQQLRDPSVGDISAMAEMIPNRICARDGIEEALGRSPGTRP